MKEIKTIKICDGLRVNYNHEITEIEHLPDLWKMFGWDVENDANAKSAAVEITRALFCVGFVDLSPMTNGDLLTVEMLPPTD